MEISDNNFSNNNNFSRRSACGDQWDADQCLNALSVASACSAVQRHEAVLVRWTRVGSCLSRNILGFGGFYLPHPSFAFSSFEEENGMKSLNLYKGEESIGGARTGRPQQRWPTVPLIGVAIIATHICADIVRGKFLCDVGN